MQQIPTNSVYGFLHLSKEQVGYILDHISDYICLHDLEGRITDVNLPWQKKYGFNSPGEVIGKYLKELMPKKQKPLFDDYIKRILNTGHDRGLFTLLPPDGQEQTIEYQSFLLYDPSGKPREIAALGQDVTHRARAEKNLRESEKKYRTIIESIQEGYYEVDLAGNIVFSNPSLCAILGYPMEELAGMNYRAYADPNCSDTIFQTFNQVYQTRNTTKASGWKFIRKDGSDCYIETSISLVTNESGTPIGFRGIILDITERMESEKKKTYLENKLRQVQKMEALGIMARGFSHNFNNILFPLMGYIEMAILELPEKTSLHDKLEKALQSATRAKNILRKIHDFARDEDKIKPEPVDVASVINETMELLKATFPKTIEVVRDIDEHCAPVMADAGQIRQIVINLCTNALDAMAEKNAGTITITFKQTAIGRLTEGPARLPAGQYIHLTVRDTGRGIDPSISDKIFDPFFSTMPTKRTGLGLTVSASFARKIGGDITMESVSGKETAFHVYLPVIDYDAASAAQKI